MGSVRGREHGVSEGKEQGVSEGSMGSVRGAWGQ